MHTKTFFALAIATLALGCNPEEVPVEEANTVRWDIQGLERLGDGYVYEGWIVVDGTPISTGRFNVDAEGNPEIDAFEVTAEQASSAGAFVLSIEPTVGDDPAPSNTKLLGGDLLDGMADLSVAHGAALGDDLTSATAPFILETPTTAGIADDYFAGIWWLDPTGPAPTLDLPDLPAGWAYEGWVVTDGPISTGRFTSVDMPDSDGAGATAGPDGAPPFPGQDFIDPELDLVGATVVISIEPEPDDSPAPFLLKPLVRADVPDLGAGSLVDMDNNASATNPVGTAWFE